MNYEPNVFGLELPGAVGIVLMSLFTLFALALKVLLVVLAWRATRALQRGASALERISNEPPAS